MSRTARLLFACAALAAACQRAPTYQVRVTGDEFRWQIRHPGPDARLDTADDRITQQHLELPARRRVALDLRSNDYVYSLYLPQIPVLEVAVPGDPVIIDFETGEERVLELLGNQMCGYTHPELLGELRVLSHFEPAAADQGRPTFSGDPEPVSSKR